VSGSLSRRSALGGLAAATLFAPAVLAQAKPRIIVIGGGYGGATCARDLHRLGMAVTLIEENAVYTSCPFSNLVLHGSRDISSQQFNYDAIAREGVEVVALRAQGVDGAARRVLLSDGRTLAYDRLVLSPGIDVRFDALPGYDASAADIMPHAWKAGAQTLLLRRQLEAMPDGGTFVMSVPNNPYRCPPGPYERASLIAHYFKTQKPKSKLIVLDSKDVFSKQRLFLDAWKALYPDILEYVPLASGGKTTEIDTKTKTVVTEFGAHKGDVVNVIPPQRAGAIAQAAGVADRSGWCPIDPVTFESRLQPNIHVIGDASIAGAMPKSAFSANAQAKACAQAIALLTSGQAAREPKLINTCYSLVAPDYGISVAGVYQPGKGILADVPGAGGVSQLNASPAVRATEAQYAHDWFKITTAEVFG
jgi:NADPH-dependent 2,4-dienoyl-CoA reductase/sulfur reductase-like enzyme